MKLTFLGTSAGQATKERNVSALGLQFDEEKRWYLFDCGEGTQRQIIQSSLSVEKLEAIFITHLHGDHYYGLPGLLSTKKLDGSSSALTIYAPQGMKKFLESAIDLSEENLGYSVSLIEYKFEEEFCFEKFSLKVLPLLHSKESAAFYIKESAQGSSLIIAGDNAQPDILGKYLKNLDLLVHECTFTQEVYDKMPTKYLHTTARELGITVQKYHVKNLIANHINPRYNKNRTLNVEMIYDEIESHYKNRLFIANDFDVYSLSKGELSLV